MTTCPKCGSRFLRPSKPRDSTEMMKKFLFIDPLRCLDCHTRFIARSFVWADLKFGRCPKCHRMDLNVWTGKTYEPPLWMDIKISLGAKRYRCEYCRINFVSFRQRKEVFSFSRWKKLNVQQQGPQKDEKHELEAEDVQGSPGD